jgi:hypothetical protein
MKSHPPSTGYSAQVRLQMVVGNRTLELGQIGPEGVVVREPVELPPGQGEVVMHVDDFERRWQVYLPDGISSKSREVRTIALPAAVSAAQ